uniref:Kinesin-like protein n=2 Tax=Guillardia theta TaxID=55529 RepID=A0A7S4L3J9_GUITH|mmetsp:Transcript_36818/g.115200  ORF Transcript_36818/g.115200 Transcript_36818/m.115200 type:complete len:944 (+) Transcript_36818:247-3078(+)
MGLRESENIRVIVRVRPLDERELRRGEDENISCVRANTVQVAEQNGKGKGQKSVAYQFDRCFGPECTQELLFEECGVLPLLDHVLEGYSSTIFAYGPTGSGKTYTITGSVDRILRNGSGDVSDGIVIRSVEALFSKIRSLQRDGLQFKIRASCVEIYNESVLDLFKYRKGSRDKQHLPVKFDTMRGCFFVQDLSYGKCASEEEILKLYMKALKNRSVAGHELNRDSSRSHALLTLYVDSMEKQEDGIVTRHGKISFVDLAGSERLEYSKSEGSTLKETGAINKSIFTLGKVISSLCDRKRTKVPYRDSKLTQLLMDSLGGTSLTIMLACISPSNTNLSESVRTLEYASRAKNIKNKPVVLLDQQQSMVKELQKEIEALRAENRALKQALLSKSNGDVSVLREGTSMSAPEHEKEVSAHGSGSSRSMRHSMTDFPEIDLHRSESVISFPSPKRKQFLASPKAAQEAHPISFNSSKTARHEDSWMPSIHKESLPTTDHLSSREDKYARERAIMKDLDDMAKFSYFDDRTPKYGSKRRDSSEGGAYGLRSQADSSRGTKDVHQRRVLQVGRGKKSTRFEKESSRARRPLEFEREGLSRLEDAGKLNYFSDDMKPSRSSSVASTPGFSRSSSTVDSRPTSDLLHQHLFPRSVPHAQPAAGDEAPSWFSESRRFSNSSMSSERGAATSFEPASPKSVMTGHASALRLSPKVTLPSAEQDSSPKSIRSQVNWTRPQSPDREQRLLDEALDEVLSHARGASRHPPAPQPEPQTRSHGQAEEWIKLLNPLAALDFDKGSSSWETELNQMMQTISTRDSSSSLSHLPAAPADRVRPLSGKKPPLVPRQEPPVESSISEASRTFDQYRERARRLEDVSSRHAHAAGKSYAPPERIRESLRNESDRGEVTWTSRSDENSTFDALMRNLEQSRAKAQQARKSILEKKAQWENKIV